MSRSTTALLAAALMLGAGLLGTTIPSPTNATSPQNVASEETCAVESSTDHTLTPEDVEIAITVHQPELEDGETAPVILHSHGWSGSRQTSPSGTVADLVEACYGVVSIDMRGHGDSGGQAHVHSPDHEIQDVIGVLDWIHDELDWVETEDTPHDKDLVAGAIGGSYGGGYQLLTAALDERLDAIAPNMTWNDLPYALAPNGAVKSVWVDALYAAGTAEAELAPFIHQGYAWAQAFNEFPDGEDPGEPDVQQRFVDSSPSSYPDAIDVPALLLQSVEDTLFNLNQAVDNYQQIEDAGSEDVRLVTYGGGHILHTEATLPDAPVPIGLQPTPAASACGALDEKIVAWYDHHLKGAEDPGIAEVEISLDDGETCLANPDTRDLVLGDEAATTNPLDDPIVVTQGAGTVSGHVEAGPAAATPTSPTQVEVFAPGSDTAVTGIPTLDATATVAGEGAIAYLSLVVEEDDGSRVLASQTTPLRLDGPANEVEVSVDLGGVAASLDEGQTVYLQASSTDTVYAHNAQRTPGALVLDDVSLDLPVH